MSNRKPKVVLIERVLLHYRSRFYDSCRSHLAGEGIDFSLVYGQPDATETKKSDTADLAWAHKIENVYLPARLVYQPCWGAVRQSDLIIVEQANRLLLNYLLLALKPLSRYRIGFIGHGYCHQAQRGSASNRFKRLYTNIADWWFPYTDTIGEFLRDSGYPGDRITVLDNAIDTEEMVEMSRGTRPDELAELKRSMSIGPGRVGVYCGAMYPEKEIGFLLAACRAIKERVSDFHMVFIGGGHDESLVREAALQADWIHFVGPQFGLEKVRLLMAADVFLLPGVVGLAILDCFAVGIPLLTTRNAFHGPEIAYLRENENGMMADFDPQAYSAMVVEVLKNDQLLARLKAGSLRSRDRYSMQNMVNRFCSGVMQWLDAR